MVSNKLTFIALVATVALMGVRADDGEGQPGEIKDWCPPCKRLLGDFEDALKTDGPQKFYDRVCNDLFLEDEKTNQLCQQSYDHFFTAIRDELNSGKSVEDICTDFGACPAAASQNRQKFMAVKKDQKLLVNMFSKLF